MSDTMLLGILRMPLESAMATLTARIQYYQTGVQAADEIEKRTRDRGYLLAEVERQARHIAELREKIDGERSCACLFDSPGDVCVAHSPALAEAQAEVERLTRERDEARAEVQNMRLRAESDEALIDAARAHRNNLRAEIERTHALLKDPNAVAINMLRGVIALPSADQIRHIYQQTLEAKS